MASETQFRWSKRPLSDCLGMGRLRDGARRDNTGITPLRDARLLASSLGGGVPIDFAGCRAPIASLCTSAQGNDCNPQPRSDVSISEGLIVCSIGGPAFDRVVHASSGAQRTAGAARSPDARHKPGRSFLVSQVVRTEGLDEHVLLDMNATDERQGGEPRQRETDPVAKHCSDANEDSDRGRVERMSHTPVRTRLNKLMVGVDRQCVTVESPEVPAGRRTQHPGSAKQASSSEVRRPPGSDGCSRPRERGCDPARDGGEGRDVEESARGCVDDSFLRVAGTGGRSGCSARCSKLDGNQPRR